MIYFKIFTIFLATSFMMIVFYGDLATVKSLLAGLCGGFVAVVAAQNSTGIKLRDMEKHLKQLEAKLTAVNSYAACCLTLLQAMCANHFFSASVFVLQTIFAVTSPVTSRFNFAFPSISPSTAHSSSVF